MDFHPRGVAERQARPPGGTVLKRIAAGDSAHNDRLARVLTDAGQTPATADDIDFTYPKNTFATGGSILKLALKIETLSLGALPRRTRDRRVGRPAAAPRADRSERGTARRRGRRACSATRRSATRSRSRFRSTPCRRRWTPTRADVAKQVYTASEAASRAGHQPRHAAPLGQGGPHRGQPRREQPPDRRRGRDRPAARRRRRAADQRPQPLSGRRHRGEDRRPDGPGRDRRDATRCAWSRSSRATRSRSSACEAGMTTTAIVKSTNVMIQR